MSVHTATALLFLSAFTAAAEEAEQLPRVRAGIGLAAGAGGPGFAGGGGLSGELGAVVAPRLSVSARVTATAGVYTYGAAAVGADWALSDQWTVGAGAGLALMGGFVGEDLPMSRAVVFPLRVSLAPFVGTDWHPRRRGLLLSLEVAPGFTFSNSAGMPSPGAAAPRNVGFALTAQLCVGYAVW